jgi:hypothetical protein
MAYYELFIIDVAMLSLLREIVLREENRKHAAWKPSPQEVPHKSHYGRPEGLATPSLAAASLCPTVRAPALVEVDPFARAMRPRESARPAVRRVTKSLPRRQGRSSASLRNE